MISQSDIIEIGRLLKTHGVSGEIAFAPLYDIDLKQLKCVFVLIDGLPVPFFIDRVRAKGKDTDILKFSDLDSDEAVSILANKTLFALKEELDVDDNDDIDDDSINAYKLVGYTMVDNRNGGVIGTVSGIDDSTANVLFLVEAGYDNDKSLIHVPIADEFISDVDVENKTIRVNLPEGLLEL